MKRPEIASTPTKSALPPKTKKPKPKPQRPATRICSTCPKIIPNLMGRWLCLSCLQNPPVKNPIDLTKDDEDVDDNQ